ncbi:hypothetical protein N473_08945 [Pseudoalteromonas luteoviolacea CPMOR-1]|uniref:Uncharacterized protein n=1 Tax=Pseudoalteromonas luteoviolacea CPMOR-1 TaxID=1365248 RepID=A0A161YV44_9GAMM|nr:hypothetical protein N473_08945 [Pseudoalteromonas luteoviolacea CPMOR-1]
MSCFKKPSYKAAAVSSGWLSSLATLPEGSGKPCIVGRYIDTDNNKIISTKNAVTGAQ